MTEIRTTSATGGEKGVKPERMDLLPTEGLLAISRVFGFGAQKYADHNWRRKYEWGKSLAALYRHISAFANGETYDPESGLPHLAHAGFHILVLLTWLEEDGEGVDNPMDDRWPAAMERARRAEEPKFEFDLVSDIEWGTPKPPTTEEIIDSINRAKKLMGWVADYDTEHGRTGFPVRWLAGWPDARFAVGDDGATQDNHQFFGVEFLKDVAPDEFVKIDVTVPTHKAQVDAVREALQKHLNKIGR